MNYYFLEQKNSMFEKVSNLNDDDDVRNFDLKKNCVNRVDNDSQGQGQGQGY